MSRRVTLLAVCLVVATASAVTGQGLLGRIKQKVDDRVAARADAAMDATLDQIEGAVKCVSTDKACIKRGQDAGKPVIVTDDQGHSLAAQPYLGKDKASAATGNSAAPAAGSDDGGAPPTKVWVNYDFVPGDSVIFAEDFTADPIGEFPRRMELKSGNYEVATVNNVHYLRGTSSGVVVIPLGAVLPQRFTMEFDAMVIAGGYAKVTFVRPEEADQHGVLLFNPSESGVQGQGMNSTSEPAEDVQQKVFHARAMVDGKHVKVYVNGKRVANAPDIDLGRSDRIQLDLPGSEEMPMLLTNIRIAAGGKTLYDAIVATGRVATHGLLFDTGSDRLRDESTPTLKLMGDMLAQHPELKLTIEGHTDNVGADAANQSLSERRAAAVKMALVNGYHVDASRLTTKGFGASRPTVPNATPEGRQTNRRVELVKTQQ